jgi:hypothetical protein
MAIATSAALPCWKRPMTSRRSAGLWLSNVAPLVESHHAPAMKCAHARERRLYFRLSRQKVLDLSNDAVGRLQVGARGRLDPQELQAHDFLKQVLRRPQLAKLIDEGQVAGVERM